MDFSRRVTGSGVERRLYSPPRYGAISVIPDCVLMGSGGIFS